jgi:hypothetical protein
MADIEDVWTKLAAPLSPDTVEWRQQGKPKNRDGKNFGLFVAYVEAGTVRERLDSIAAGAWDFKLETYGRFDIIDKRSGNVEEQPFALKAALSIHGVTREDIGQGSDYKAAATDAFKRAAQRFGIGNELSAMPKLWLELDGDGTYAKPIEDPKSAALKKFGGGSPERSGSSSKPSTASDRAPAKAPSGSRFPDAPFRDFLMPFGEYKKQPLSAIPEKELRGAIKWAEDLGKFADMVEAGKKELKWREDQVGQGDLMAGAGAKGNAKPSSAMPASFDDDFPAALEDQDDDLPF